MYINYAMRDIKASKFLENCKYNPLKKGGGLNKKRHISMLKVKLCPPKFKRTGSAYILFFSIIHFVCDIFFFWYNSVIPSFTEPVL
jgi:hypothetical protein